MDLAWLGLSEYEGEDPTIAWSALDTTEQTRIRKLMSDYVNNGPSNCN